MILVQELLPVGVEQGRHAVRPCSVTSENRLMVASPNDGKKALELFVSEQPDGWLPEGAVPTFDQVWMFVRVYL